MPFDVAEASGVFSNDIGVMKPQLKARTRWENLTKEQMVCDERILQSLSLPHTFNGKQGTSIEHVFEGSETVIDKKYRLEMERRTLIL